MQGVDIPAFGSFLLSAALVAASYAFFVSVRAHRQVLGGQTALLSSARFATWSTCALVAVAVCLLAYAFQTHDFRITYVSRYSDRSMTTGYLLAALWGGQDGSLLWWTFLLCGWTGACMLWLKSRYQEYQPALLATLMAIVMFFLVLQLFAANPFKVNPAAAPVDGEGLNPLLQNYWMAIHPPTLYMGFVGWAVPFAFAVSALVTGRLGNEWLRIARPWVLAVWLFLSIGLVLGMVWSYEELGWGGYWAWDPVENASFFPWLAGTAFLHSVMVQERRGMLKIWNVSLICLTFFLTIYGTFLTRSGLIASVHSFARSDIGIYFVYFMVVIAVVSAALIIWRLPRLRAENRMESLLSRDFAFLLNNWILLAMLVFVLVATMFPLISEWVRNETVTVGPPFYNRWMIPLGLILLFLAGMGPLLSWRKMTGKSFQRAMMAPTIAAIAFGVLHLIFGSMIGMPAIVHGGESIYETATGTLLEGIFVVAPLASTSVVAFLIASVVQEFVRGTRARMRSKEEPWFTALTELTFRAKRRYGGYIVHVGIAVMYLGFTGAAYDVQNEATLKPGESLEVGHFRLRYDGPYTTADINKQMAFGRLTLLNEEGEELSQITPAKFIYRTHPQMPTTEVSIRTSLSEDLYVIMSTIDPESQLGTFRAIIRPLVLWIWIGAALLILGTLLAMSPSLNQILSQRGRPGSRTRPAIATAVISMIIVALFAASVSAQDQSGSSSLHAGTVIMHNDTERGLFEKLLCMCGGCQRLQLSNCACSWADDARAEIRSQLAAGTDPGDIIDAYRQEHGAIAISIPSDEGLDRALWAVPLGMAALAVVGLFWLGARWRMRTAKVKGGLRSEALADETRDNDPYDARLDEELERFGS